MIMRARLARSGVVALAAALVLLTTSCAVETPQEDAQGSGGGADAAQAPAGGGDGDGEYAFGTDREQIAYSIEEAFSSKNAKARWEGDTLVLALDGDADKAIAGFTECRVLAELLTDDDVSAVEFPNGRVECADVLPE